jgi:hypothetical protein
MSQPLKQEQGLNSGSSNWAIVMSCHVILTQTVNIHLVLSSKIGRGKAV